MPTYDYACAACGAFTARQALAAFDQPAPCPACGRPAPRALSVPAWLGRSSRSSASLAGDRQVANSAVNSASDAGYQRLRHGGAGGSCSCCPPASA